MAQQMIITGGACLEEREQRARPSAICFGGCFPHRVCGLAGLDRF
jgi:hypothetical protein